LTNLPLPTGRVPNYSEQNKVIASADVFIFVVSTAQFSKRNLMKCPHDKPAVCWIDNAGEEAAIEKWKKDKKLRFLSLSRTASDFASSKADQEKTLEAYRFRWHSEPSSYPITNFKEVKKIVGKVRGDIEIFSSNATSLKKILLSKEIQTVSSEFQAEWEKMLKKTKELAEHKESWIPKIQEISKPAKNVEQLDDFPFEMLLHHP